MARGGQRDRNRRVACSVAGNATRPAKAGEKAALVGYERRHREVRHVDVRRTLAVAGLGIMPEAQPISP